METNGSLCVLPLPWARVARIQSARPAEAASAPLLLNVSGSHVFAPLSAQWPRREEEIVVVLAAAEST